MQPPPYSSPVLVANAAYATASPAVTCPAVPRSAASRDELRTYVTGLIGCLNRELGAYLGSPPAQAMFFSGRVDTKCGALTSTAYCPSAMTIYFDPDEYNPSKIDHAQYVWVHEYMHHVQQWAGILSAGYAEGADRMDVSRRIELQAVCWETMFAARQQWMRWDFRSWYYGYSGDERHGSTVNIRLWGAHGARNSTLGSCNTWVAAAGTVAY